MSDENIDLLTENFSTASEEEKLALSSAFDGKATPEEIELLKNSEQNQSETVQKLLQQIIDNQKGIVLYQKGNTYFQNNNSNVVDWTDKFEKVPTFEEIEKNIKDIIASGEVFDTLSPNWKIDIKGGNRVVDKITNQGNFQKLQNSAKKRHNKYVAGIKELINNSNYNHSSKNDKSKEKPNILNYHYFDVNIKIGDKTYLVMLECEENKKVHQGRYAKRSKQSHQNINTLTQKNNNVKIVHLYNIKEIKQPNIYFQFVYHGTPHKFDNFSTEHIGSGNSIEQRTDKAKYLTDNEVEQLKKDQENFESYIEKLLNNELSHRTQIRVLEHLTSPYDKIVNLKGKKVVITQDVYKKIIDLPNKFNKNHNIDRNRALKLPQLIADPLYILKSNSEGNEHRFVIVTSSKGNFQGQKLSIILNPKNTVAIVSAYDEKIDISKEKKAGRVLYSKKEELSKTILTSKARAINNSNIIIANNSDNFNPSENTVYQYTRYARGYHLLDKNLITILKDGNVDTVIHEYAHWYLNTLASLEGSSQKVDDALADIRKFLKNDGSKFSEKQHEKFAISCIISTDIYLSYKNTADFLKLF